MTRTCVNGKLVEEKTQLKHGDRILWGNNHYFRINCPRLPGLYYFVHFTFKISYRTEKQYSVQAWLADFKFNWPFWLFRSRKCCLQGVYHFQKVSGTFSLTVRGKAILVCPIGRFPNPCKRNVSRSTGSPKFPTEVSERKIVFHLHFPTSCRSCAYGETSSRLSVS